MPMATKAPERLLLEGVTSAHRLRIWTDRRTDPKERGTEVYELNREDKSAPYRLRPIARNGLNVHFADIPERGRRSVPDDSVWMTLLGSQSLEDYESGLPIPRGQIGWIVEDLRLIFQLKNGRIIASQGPVCEFKLS